MWLKEKISASSDVYQSGSKLSVRFTNNSVKSIVPVGRRPTYEGVSTVEIMPLNLGPRPPLQLAWRSAASVSVAVANGGTVYGITSAGSVTAFRADTGAARWQTTAAYLPGRLAVDGTTVYALQHGVGLVGVADQGNTFMETTLLPMNTLDGTTSVSNPVPLGGRVHLIKGDRLYAVGASSGGLQYERVLGTEGPYTLCAMDGDLLVVSGSGRPSRLRPGTSGYSVIWNTGQTGAEELVERCAVVAGDRVLVAEPGGVAAYTKQTGGRLWGRPGVGNMALAAQGDTAFAAGAQAALWALNLADGSVRWNRQYLAFAAMTPRLGLAVSDNHLWVGVLMDDGAEPAALFAVNLGDGNFAWQATSVSIAYGNGLPLAVEGRLYSYGSADPLTAMDNLPSAPGVTIENIRQTPNPLKGPMSGFNPVEVFLALSVGAHISFICWHERDVRNNAVGPIDYDPGRHTISYDARFPRGWTDINQFGRLAVEVEEKATGLRYSQVLLVPVNTLPDIHHHWGKRNIETMIYHRYIGGYPDLTFKPDNLVTRGESSAIIALTLGLQRPGSGFRTKFTDISGHWARNYIMALEERGVIGGFLEPDGTYTFRPNLNMTRAQEARILVNAYAIAPAPGGFHSRFTDVAGHWAEADVKALEAGGYVTGFREPDGSYTYRPEQNLTRAELCTVVVRVRNLVR